MAAAVRLCIILFVGLSASCSRTALDPADAGAPAVDGSLSGRGGSASVLDASPDVDAPAPRGEWLAFQVGEDFEEAELRVLDVTASAPPRVLSDVPYKTLNGGDFGWSPDGASLFYGVVPLETQSYSGATELFVASFDDPVRIPRRVSLPVAHGESIGVYGFGADSRTLRWLIERPRSFPRRVYWLDVSDPLAEPQFVVDNLAGKRSAWSPDSYRFAYEVPLHTTGDPGHLFLVDLEDGRSSEPEPVQPAPERDEIVCDWHWSSSSRWLLYSDEAERYRECDVYAVRIDQGTIGASLHLNPDLGSDGKLYPAPDSDKLLFAARPEGSDLALYIVDLSGGEPVGPTLLEQAIPTDSTFGFGRWLDSNRFVYETSQAGTRTGWLADLRHEPLSFRAFALPDSWPGFDPFSVAVRNANDESLQMLYRVCRSGDAESGCPEREWTWFDATNSRELPLGLFATDGHVAFSPDGRRAVLDGRTRDDEADMHDLYVLEFSDGDPGPAVRVDRSRQAVVTGSRKRPAWSPTSYAFAFLTDEGKLAWSEADGRTVRDVSTADEHVLNFEWRPR
jgi:hypothetical protein